MIRQNELMNVRYSERGSLLGIKIYTPSSECLIECVDIPEQHVPNLDFRTECREFKREDSENLEKSVCIALCRVRYYTKLLRITNQWYSVPVKFQFGQNRDFLAFLSLPLTGGPREAKRFKSSWRLISPSSFHTSSDNRERNRTIRLTLCCTQFKPFGNKTFCFRNFYII